jgi:DNA-binding response OmpR family regulator
LHVTKFLSNMQNFWSARHLARSSAPLVTASADAQARGVLKEAADRKNWGIQFTNSCEEAWMIANRLTAPVILCDRDLPETEWRQAVLTLAALPHRPIVILLSEVADEYLWSELFRIGGFDILAKPLRTKDVRRAVKLALSCWRSEAATAVKSG